MQCTCFNKTVNKFYNLIEEDHLYEIRGGYVKINDKKYTRIKADYKIVLDENGKYIIKQELPYLDIENSNVGHLIIKAENKKMYGCFPTTIHFKP